MISDAIGAGGKRMLGAVACVFAAIDVYGMLGVAAPYYTGVIGHRANGTLMALHISDVRTFGFFTMFQRLAENKWAVLSQPVLIVLWALGLVTSYTMGGLIHILLIVAIIALILHFVRGTARAV